MSTFWQGWSRRRAFYRSLPWRSQLAVYGAIFFTFASVGFVDDMMNVKQLTPGVSVVADALFTGVYAAGYAFAFTRDLRLLVLLVPFHVLVPAFFLPALRARFPEVQALALDAPAVTRRLQADGFACMAAIVAGYALFIRFIGTAGARQVRLRTEVALAERIHSSLVPPIAIAGGRFEVYGRSDPSSEVGGDLLDAVERDGRLLLCVADVSGHGVSAGSFMGMVKSAVRMKLLSSGAVDALLDDLNEVVCQMRSSEMFVTLAGLSLDATNVAEVGLAGHPSMLHARAATGAIEAIENRFPPLGVVPGQRHASVRVRFEPGDLFVLLTDGLTEVANRSGELFGMSGVEAVLRRQLRQPLAAIHAALLDAVRAHGPQTDDQTLLLVRIG